MKNILTVALCMLCTIVPVTVFAAVPGYDITYCCGSIPAINSGSGLQLYLGINSKVVADATKSFDINNPGASFNIEVIPGSGLIQLVRDNNAIAYIPVSSLKECCYGEGVYRRISAAIGMDFASSNAMTPLTSKENHKSNKHYVDIGLIWEEAGKLSGVVFRAADDKRSVMHVNIYGSSYNESFGESTVDGERAVIRGFEYITGRQAVDSVASSDLFLAANNGDIKSVKSLLAAGVNVNAKDNDGHTALMQAAAKGATDCVKALIAAGADVQAQGNDGYTALIVAAFQDNNTDSIAALIAAGANVKAKDKYGVTALFRAAGSKNNTDSVKALLAAGAEVNAKSNFGDTALSFAVEKGNTDCVRVLIAAGAKVNTKNGDGDTALIYAAKNGNADIVKALIAAGANVNAKNKEGSTPLSLANDNPEIAKELKAAGAR